jgi:hypothetical protein
MLQTTFDSWGPRENFWASPGKNFQPTDTTVHCTNIFFLPSLASTGILAKLVVIMLAVAVVSSNRRFLTFVSFLFQNIKQKISNLCFVLISE